MKALWRDGSAVAGECEGCEIGTGSLLQAVRPAHAVARCMDRLHIPFHCSHRFLWSCGIVHAHRFESILIFILSP